MKLHLVIIVSCILNSICTIALAEQYILTIDGKQFEIELGEPQTLRLQNETSIKVNLKKKPIATFETDFFTFDYLADKGSPNRENLGDGVHQSIIVTPLGTVLLLQEYRGVNPTHLVDMMLNELTKESKEYGYSLSKEEISKPLVDGKRMIGKRITATYGAEVYRYEVLAYGKKDDGVLVATVANNLSPSSEASDRRLLKLFWKTLRIFPNS